MSNSKILKNLEKDPLIYNINHPQFDGVITLLDDQHSVNHQLKQICFFPVQSSTSTLLVDTFFTKNKHRFYKALVYDDEDTIDLLTLEPIELTDPALLDLCENIIHTQPLLLKNHPLFF